jgi:hypothetical protein
MIYVMSYDKVQYIGALHTAHCALCTMPALGKSAFTTMDRLHQL